jgi:hypothetical protein
MWIIAIIAIAVIIIAVGYIVVNYVIPKPDNFVGAWNGTVKYNGTYYDSIFVFADDHTGQAAFYYKPGLTRNMTQPTSGPLFTESMSWEAEGDHWNLIYPDGKVKLYYDGIAHTLRFNEEPGAGYITPFMGYISRYYGGLQDFTRINQTK